MALYQTRADWADVMPVLQKDAVNTLVPIAYSEKYTDAMNYFRAVVLSEEKSERVLELTESIIRINPAHYSVWAYRAATLKELSTGSIDWFYKELDLMEKLVKEHLKNYQVWQHRRTILTYLRDPSRELTFSQNALDLDAKNYHTWAYRSWTLLEFYSASSTTGLTAEEKQKVWIDELAYTEKLLVNDLRNNSAWNHRFWIVFESGSGGGFQYFERELRYVKTALAVSPNNPSAWNYLRGLLKVTNTPFASVEAFVAPLSVPRGEKVVLEDGISLSPDAELPAYFAIEFLADSLAQSLKGNTSKDATQDKQKATALYEALKEYDPVRENFWQFRQNMIQGL